MHSDIHPSLHPNCHHQIVFAKFNLTNFLSSTLQTISLALSQENTDLIKRGIKFVILTSINRFLFSTKRL